MLDSCLFVCLFLFVCFVLFCFVFAFEIRVSKVVNHNKIMILVRYNEVLVMLKLIIEH